jgi:hypothetical protein
MLIIFRLVISLCAQFLTIPPICEKIGCYGAIYKQSLAAKIHVGGLKFTGIILEIDKCWIQVLWSLNQPSLDIKGSLSLIPETNFGQGILCNL